MHYQLKYPQYNALMALTDKDLIAIKQLLRDEIDQALEKKLEEKLRIFPTREEFFSHMDEIVTELKAMRQELTIQGHQVRNQEDRISNLEETTGFPKSPSK